MAAITEKEATAVVERSIPEFPELKPLELKDMDEIEHFTNQFPPYSDYNFVSLWAYDTQGTVQLAWLNGNLVVKFQDYVTNEPFYSFLGNNDAAKTAEMLTSHAQKTGVHPTLKLIPEVVVTALDEQTGRRFNIAEDRDNFDYLLSVEDLIDMSGKDFRIKRNFANRFRKEYNPTVQKLDLNNEYIHQQIDELFERWRRAKQKDREETENERLALQRTLQLAGKVDRLSGVGVYVNDSLVGFSLVEAASDGHGVIHFEKADTAYTGSFEYLKQATAIHVGEHGVRRINYEQDLGIPGLREAKTRWHPVGFLRKYTVSPKVRRV